MDEEENRMPSEEWLNSVIGSAIELADEELRKIVYPFDLGEIERVYTLAYLNGLDPTLTLVAKSFSSGLARRSGACWAGFRIRPLALVR